MGTDWLTLGFRILRVDPGRLGGSALHKPYLSVSESMIDMVPDDSSWYATAQSAIASRRDVPGPTELIGVACSSGQRQLIDESWAPPVDAAYVPIRPRESAELNEDLILGFEPAALDFQTFLSWRYFGGDEIEWLFRRKHKHLHDNGLVASYARSIEICEQMNVLTAVEQYEWVSLALFEVEEIQHSS